MKNSKSKSTNDNKNNKPAGKLTPISAKESTIVAAVANKPTSHVVNMEKIVDGQGVAIRPKNDANPEKSSRFGVTPSIFYDSNANFKGSFDEIDVVLPYNSKHTKKAIKIATKEVHRLEDEAILQFDHDVTRAKLVTTKNLEIARVEALRILTKAIIIEKNHHEQVYEKKCHEEALKNIALLKEAKLILNDKELTELLFMLEHDYELELKNNEIDYERVKIKVQELQAIHQVKRRLIRQQIKEINQGRHFNIFNTFFGRITPLKLVNEIKKNKFIPKHIYSKNDFSNIDELNSMVKGINVKTLPPEQQKIFERFIRLMSTILVEDDYAKKTDITKEQLNQLANEIKLIKKSCVNPNRNLVNLDKETTRTIVDAKKQLLTISKPANLYAVNVKYGSEKKVISKDIVVKTKTIQADFPSKIDPASVRQPITKMNKVSNDLALENPSLNKKTIYADDTLSKQVTKFKKLQGNDFDKNKHLKHETIEYTNYRWEWKTNALENRKSEVDTYYTDVEFQTADSGLKFIDFKQLFKSRDEKNIIRLKKLVANLPEDPIVVNNLGTFKKENLDVEKIITQFKSLTEEEILENAKNEKLINDIETILQIYYELSITDYKYRKGVIKAQAFDHQLAKIIKKQDIKVCNIEKQGSIKFQKNKIAIEERYQLDLDSAKNQYLINKELIIDEEQSNFAKEEEIYLWNSCVQYKKSNNFMNQEFNYENNIISSVINKVVQFNKKSDNPIPLTNIPSKILPLPMNSNARIDVSIEKIGTNQYIVAQNTDHKNKLLTKYEGSADLEKVQKIYVLDKFRAVKDIKTRVALLTSYANIEYLKVVEANKAREAKEIKLAQVELDKKLVKIDQMYHDIGVMSEADTKLGVISKDAKQIQDEYIKVKEEQWRVYNKGLANKSKNYYKENKKNKAHASISFSTKSAADLEHLKQEKSKERAISLEKKAEQKEIKPNIAKDSSIKDKNTNVKKANKYNFQFHNFFKRNKDNEITIDEIIGKDVKVKNSK